MSTPLSPFLAHRLLMSSPSLLLTMLLLLGPLAAAAQQPASADLADLSDEFGDPASLARWRQYHEVEEWPNMLRRIDIGDTSPGHLYLEPATSGWYADWHAPFMFKEVAGDFDATVRLSASGLRGGLPSRTWSLTGLMVRAPRAITSRTWTPGGENWVFITTGIGAEAGQPAIETKTTVNSASRLRLAPACAGWIELRVVRVGAEFTLSSRCGDGGWTVRERFSRPDLPGRVQVGLVAYTDWDHIEPRYGNDPHGFNTRGVPDGTPDLAVRVDWVRFSRPR
jgi:hypothetical protein